MGNGISLTLRVSGGVRLDLAEIRDKPVLLLSGQGLVGKHDDVVVAKGPENPGLELRRQRL